MNRPIKIGVVVKTFGRDGCIQSLVASLESKMSFDYRFYIADEAPISPSKEELYGRLVSEGHFVYVYKDVKEPISVCAARNFLVSKLEEEDYVLRLDDDFLLTDETKLDVLVGILASRSEIGAVSGIERQARGGKRVKADSISPGQGVFMFDSKRSLLVRRLLDVNSWHWMSVNGSRFAYANFTRNFLLIKRQVFDRVNWEEQLLIEGEHIDFMLSLQQEGWALAFTPDSIHVHKDPPPEAVAKSYSRARFSRNSNLSMKEVFSEKWGVEKMLTVGPAFDLDPLILFEKFKRYVRDLLKNDG